ncbi:MAG TPA: ferrochelatase [Sulfuriferula sp.]|nr:ferrochelatase [Sulfuriferula sp.]
MPNYLTEPAHAHGNIAKTGILLINLGTPDAPTKQALKSYLKEFLSDPRVVEIPRAIWWLILNGVILNTRPKKSAQKYASIWTSEGSPLRFHTEKQAKLLKGWLGERIKSPLVVEYAMRYGNPSVASAMNKLGEQGCDRILALPMYPQYAASSTATAFDAIYRILLEKRNQPALRTLRHYHDDPGYIAALTANVHDYWMRNGRPEMLVMSFHGVPRYTLDKGDPYHCECQKTARLLAEALGLSREQYRVTFQSRFGRAEWIKPYTVTTLEELGRAHTKRVDVVCPGFVSDCLETLEEIAMEVKQTFLAAGGGEFHYIPALNERPEWIAALGELALANLSGWVSPQWDAAQALQNAEASRARAIAAGAAV